ncbi:hypothetical protein S245_025923, partial [Arachis hypogaea]
NTPCLNPGKTYPPPPPQGVAMFAAVRRSQGLSPRVFMRHSQGSSPSFRSVCIHQSQAHRFFLELGGRRVVAVVCRHLSQSGVCLLESSFIAVRGVLQVLPDSDLHHKNTFLTSPCMPHYDNGTVEMNIHLKPQLGNYTRSRLWLTQQEESVAKRALLQQMNTTLPKIKPKKSSCKVQVHVQLA